MKSVDILFKVNPGLAKCGPHLAIRDSKSGTPVLNISEVGEVVQINKEDGICALRIPIQQPWLLVSEIDLTDPVAHPKCFIVRLYAIDGEYHGSLEERAFGDGVYNWVDNRNSKIYPMNHFKYYQPIEGPPDESN